MDYGANEATADSIGVQGKEKQQRGSPCACFHHDVNHAGDAFFYRLGRWVATHAKLTLLICILFVFVCCLGFANFKTETNGKDLWVPANSKAKKHEVIINEFFDNGSDFAVILVESPAGGDNVLSKASVDTLWEIDALVWSLETSDGETLADLCVRELDGVTCSQPFRGVTRFWGGSFDSYEASVTSDADVLEAINVDVFPDGGIVLPETIFGDSFTYDASGAVTGARVMMQSYSPVAGSGANVEWEKVFQDFFEENADSYANVFTIRFLTSRSIDDALGESLSGEIFLFVLTYIVMVSFAQISLGRCGAGAVRRRTWLGVSGVLSVLAAGLASFGVNAGFGVPFTSLVQTLPFILIGIGVDDMFVIVAAFDHTDPNLPVEERIALALTRCGVSVTYTSLTNCMAFMLGSLTRLPAVEYFCLYAGTAILFDYFLQMTAFVALLTMDANRQKAGKLDWCCCFTNKKFLEEENIRRGVDLSGSADIVENKAPREEDGSAVHTLGSIGTFLKEKYTPVILSAKGKTFVLLTTAGLLTAGIYGVTKATQGFDVVDLAPDGHFASEYTELARKYNVEFDTQFVPMSIYTRKVDYPDITVQAAIQETDELMVSQRFVHGPSTSWLSSLVEWANSTAEYSANVGTEGGYMVYTDRDTFYTALTAFTQDGENARFESDIVYNDAGEIEISRSDMLLIDLLNTADSVTALRDSRDVIAQSPLDPEPFAFSGVFIFIEQFAVIYRELLTNFMLALGAVALLSAFVLGKVVIVTLVCVTVSMIDVELLGFVYHYGLEVNSITVIELVMAVGLVVDYMVHIVHYFLHQSPSMPKDSRIASALGEIGPSVFLGAMTTFLGIMPMAFANNFIFRVFFRMFIIIIAFGFYHGIVFIPVALSVLPDSVVSNLPSKDGHEYCTSKGSAVVGTRPHRDGS